jgi:hypothetical protein
MTSLTEADGVAKLNNVATFQCYKPKEGSFDGTNLKTGNFDGTDPIFPLLFCFPCKKVHLHVLVQVLLSFGQYCSNICSIQCRITGYNT